MRRLYTASFSSPWPTRLSLFPSPAILAACDFVAWCCLIAESTATSFFSTTLEILLKHLGAEILILTGLTGDICILFTASDAHLRDYRLFIPSDCVVSQDPSENKRALKFMKRVLEADIRPSSRLDFRKLKG